MHKVLKLHTTGEKKEVMQFHWQKMFLCWICFTCSLWHNHVPVKVSACEHSNGHQHLHGHLHFVTGSLRKPLNQNNNATVASIRRHLQDPSTGIEECGFMGLDEAATKADLQEFQQWKTSKSNFFEGIYYLPVYVHVIEPSADFVSDSRIDYYMSYLNNAFAFSTPFTFELKGITRTRNTAWSQSCHTYELDYKNILKVGGVETLNIYICQAIPVDGGAWAGFSTFPPLDNRDGVVIAEQSTPIDARPNTLVHEVVRQNILWWEVLLYIEPFRRLTLKLFSSENDDNRVITWGSYTHSATAILAIQMGMVLMIHLE
jgi:hypothetical protein